MLRKTAGEIMSTWVCAVSFYMLKHLDLQSFNRKTAITQNNFRHCGVRFSSFVRQPFSKQLYVILSKSPSPSLGPLISPYIINTRSRKQTMSKTKSSTRGCKFQFSKNITDTTVNVFANTSEASFRITLFFWLLCTKIELTKAKERLRTYPTHMKIEQ